MQELNSSPRVAGESFHKPLELQIPVTSLMISLEGHWRIAKPILKLHE